MALWMVALVSYRNGAFWSKAAGLGLELIECGGSKQNGPGSTVEDEPFFPG
jgi:hypothetical protein